MIVRKLLRGEWLSIKNFPIILAFLQSIHALLVRSGESRIRLSVIQTKKGYVVRFEILRQDLSSKMIKRLENRVNSLKEDLKYGQETS